MKKYPKISVITPSFNQGSFIEETIKSVVSQNYPNLEYIIKDARSTDDSVQIIESYAKKYPKVIKWVSKRDRGQADGINQGVRMATGEIITYLNSDDIYFPDTLKTVGEYFSQNTSAMWATGDYVVVDEDGQKIHSAIVAYKRLLRKLPSRSTLYVANYIAQPSTFWRSKLTEKIGFFDEKEHFVMDYDYWLRAIHKYPLHQIHKPLSKFRIHNTSKGKLDYERQFKQGYEVVKKYTKNPFIIAMHLMHAKLIIFIYKQIK